jgi:probable addiction module antidote protein
MTLKTHPFDPSKYLDNDAAVAAYIDASLAEDNAAELADALGVVARARGMSQLARDTGLSRESLYKALSEDGNPSLDTLLRVMKALRLKLSVVSADASEAAE